ncbi:creatinase/Prolidase N-terminal domain protein [Mycobacterium ulcerans str. Harvey]|uniref:Creatinase/Prolidase N-terminal domain protein n=1 Tax=Mycobacterium ulcerans str. Harvey TaxID=1299332 RepID=A0ABN0R6T5_MYCUL|nr:creatinase/Prolidase N-terminal domain protein [Mycobacterium ulcerans str. Harvey]
MSTEVLPDNRALRCGRRQRALEQMAAHDLDVLVLGRQANVRYVSGTPQLWVAGTRPFGPTCVLVRATGAIHLLSTWDEGVPDDIPHENLYGISWNPMNTISVLERIDGAATARRVGTDALSPVFAQLLPQAFPNAELVDDELAMRAARRIKTDEEVVALRAAIAVAESGLAAAVAELRTGVSEQLLAGVLVEAVLAGGVSTPSNQDVAWVTSREHPWRRASGDRRVRSGDLVAFSAGSWPADTSARWAEPGRRRCCGRRAAVPTMGEAVGWAAFSVPAGCGGRRIAECLPAGRRTGAADAGSAGPGNGL